LPHWYPHELRRQATSLLAGDSEPAAFITFVLERICGFTQTTGTWLRGSAIGAEWSRRTATGDTVRPRQLWRGPHGSLLPVFLDSEKQVGIGRGRRTASLVVQWLRAGGERLALLTNGRQWRLIFAGLDFDAWCEWDTELWFEEGQLSSQVNALRTLLSPRAWTAPADGQNAPLLTAVLDSRKGQAELSAALGERVREAVELLVQAHGEVLQEQCAHISSAEIYRAAVRVVMRLVVILFAESRDLLPRDNALYHAAYGIGGLLEELERIAARGGHRLARQYSAWPRLLALFRLVHQGSHHPALPVPAYGGELFAAAGTDSELEQALQVFESAAFDNSRAIVSDREILRVLEKISRTRVRLRQGRQNTTVTVPVDFSDLSSEYIGILYEGLLDFELKTAPTGDPVIFLAVGNQPALPLSRLEAMDDRALAALLEKMQDTSSKDAGSEEESDDTEAEPGELDSSDAPENSAEEATDAENTGPDIAESAADDGTADHRHQTRTRAELWARRAAVAGGLVKRPAAGNLTPAKQREYEELLARKARQLVIRVVLPGEWFLVRWGGTRKGSGTFYTRPGLAVPTVQRTLRPLAYAPPTLADGSPDTAAPACDWLPRAPEEILALKTCDPACGSGTFPVASLRFLTDALFASVHHHGRVADRTDRAIVSLLGPQTTEHSEIPALGQEMVPCRPQDPAFEPRLKSVLKRYLVERCIYGVDLDPLAVELCRLSLWIETMDRTLPFSFLDHKVKCGNGLVGALFDLFLHYPVMAWKNREGGDKGHTNGVHYQKEARGKALREFATGILQEDLRDCLEGPSLLDRRDHMRNATQVHTEALGLLARLHDLPVQDAAERARMYRSQLLAAPAWRQLKSAMDLWCACWFWPAESLDVAPLPSTLAQPSAQTQAEADRIAAKLRFFHWELEFPDVFRAAGSGFDAILGNPPWDIAKPNSKEFFSNLDPLYRTYGKQEALRAQTGYFADAETERRWLDYNADFRAQSNFMKYAASPFGDPATSEASSDRFSVARGRQNDTLHTHWREIRRRSTGFADPAHPFRHQGSADINLYKTFLEQAHALLTSGGRMGFIIPSGLYSDHGTGSLRRLFLDRCQWEWLFGIENREGIFEIHRSFKFNPIIIQKGGTTTAIRTAFMRRKLEDWERAEEFATAYTRTQIDRFSPRSQAILEIQSAQDLQILERIYSNSVLLGDDGPDGWGIKYKLEFMMNTDAHLFPPRTKWEEQGYRPDEYSRWLKGDWRPIAELWTVLGIDPSQVVPAAVELEDWLFDSTADPDRRAAEAQFVHGHLLKPGDVARTPCRLRCAQPPYDTLPIPRADIPEGIVLSREGDAWITEVGIEDMALPLLQGVLIHGLRNNVAEYLGGSGHRAK
ncbi:MAG: Eco57I restriction-modification methylase domain-containing protein, partial [Planctomyces sp.]